jgi:SAM-dependent methyltransferase
VLKALLEHPLTRGISIDDPRTTAIRREIIATKPFLRQLYEEWYRLLAAAVPPGNSPVLELGAGAGFLDRYIPGLIPSEIFPCPGLRAVLDARYLPFGDATLRGVVMTDVLHHIPRVADFLEEAGRCVQPGGVLAMIEPWNTPWSSLVYRHLHHEPFEPDAASWTFPSSGPLSGANGALPWMLFARDRDRFMQEFPGWRIETLRPFMPFRYLLSGGVSLRALMPGWSFAAWVTLEQALQPFANQLGMFAFIVLRRSDEVAPAAGHQAVRTKGETR